MPDDGKFCPGCGAPVARISDATNTATEQQAIEGEPQPLPLSQYPPPDATAFYPPPSFEASPDSYAPSAPFEPAPPFEPMAPFEPTPSFDPAPVFEAPQFPQEPQAQATPKKSKKSKKPLIIALGAVLLVIMLAVGAVVGFNIYRSSTYDDALAALNTGDYQQALETFESLGDYRDAPALVLRAQQEIDYAAAQALLDAEDYEAAREAFLELGDFKDARTLATLCQQNIDYRTALDAFEAGNFEEALRGFTDLAAVGFSDSADQRDATAYAIADQKFNEGDRYAAYQDFEALGSYKDSADRMQQCTIAFPATGELYHNEGYASSSSAIVIDGTSSTYTSYYKIYSGGDLVSALFLNAGSSCTIEVPPGSYTVKEASGAVWFGEEIMFGDEGHYEVLLFDGNNDYFVLEYNIKVTLTLSVADGDVGSSPTDRTDF
jgi:tetratricopeptide (TPR) repeat protein